MPVHQFAFLAIALAAVPPITVVGDKPLSEAEKNDPDRVICKKAQVSGSRLGNKKICMRKADWDAQRQADREAIQRAQVNRKNY